MQPVPVGMLSGSLGLLTQVAFIGYGTYAQPIGGGIEDEIDADGGTNRKTIAFNNAGTYVSAGAGTYNYYNSSANLSANNILWSNRYNYRIGTANCYYIESLNLYKDYSLFESQGNPAGSGAVAGGVAGWNLDPANRIFTYSGRMPSPAYSKVEQSQDMFTLLTTSYIWGSSTVAAYGTEAGAIEDGIGINGGTPLGLAARFSSGGAKSFDLSSFNILWSNRYNYRIGGVNCYNINNLTLYKNGISTENQGNISISIGGFTGAYVSGLFGFNLDPANRVTSSIMTKILGSGTVSTYPK